MYRSIILFILIPTFLFNQSLDDALANYEVELAKVDQKREIIIEGIENTKLEMIQRDLLEVGLPSDDYIMHQAMSLAYSEEHEQAKWVAHIIRPEVINGLVFRSNDFRPDPKVKTGTAVESDYFLKTLKKDSTFEYDGFGFDRGHLAPSADFRWSSKALSESYFYSNMSPQRPEFNRESWADLESSIRDYLFNYPDNQLYVVTGPILHKNLPKIERSTNGVSIPEKYFKVILDIKEKQAIGFVMPNNKIDKDLSDYALSINGVEEITKLDFFNNLPEEEKIESSFNVEHWLPSLSDGDIEPLHPPSLPKGHFNTKQAKLYMGKNKTITVCGTVIGSRYSRKGHLWFNLDRKFPNQVFSVFIKKEDLVNFGNDPQKTFDGKVIAVKGEIQDFDGVPTVNLKKEERISFFNPN